MRPLKCCHIHITWENGMLKFNFATTIQPYNALVIIYGGISPVETQSRWVRTQMQEWLTSRYLCRSVSGRSSSGVSDSRNSSSEISCGGSGTQTHDQTYRSECKSPALSLRSAVGEVGHRHMIRHTDQSARVQLWDQLWGKWDTDTWSDIQIRVQESSSEISCGGSGTQTHDQTYRSECKSPALRSAVGEVGHRHMIRHTDQSARVQLRDQLWGMWDVHARVKAPEKEWDLHSSVHQQACDKRQSGDWLHQKEAERTKWNEQVPGQSPVGPTSQRWRRGFYFIHTYCCVLSHR